MSASGCTAASPRMRTLRTLVRPCPAPRDRRSLRAAVLSLPGGFALETLTGTRDTVPHDRGGRFSYFGFDPVRVIDTPPTADPRPDLATVFDPQSALPRAGDIPFIGGWVGYLAYEVGGWYEPTARPSRHMADVPLASWSLHDAVIVADHRRGEWFVAGIEGLRERDHFDKRLAAMAELVTCASAQPAAFSVGALADDMNRERYLAAVERVKTYIADGDVFQVNLARRASAEFAGSAPGLYEGLCRANPAHYAAYLSGRTSGAAWAILSSSPELFLERRGRRVTTRPIKGTRRRHLDAAQDQAARRELAAASKDAAELAMIVDLERNDLGRVCRFGSVRVSDAGSIEDCGAVIHRVATIEGELRPEMSNMDLLRATFPGGSISGAPKVRAMQIIDELETSPRGPYCGAIGWVGLDGNLTLNLAIRTLTVARDRVHLSVGGGIVADSIPEDEFAETQAKAAGMLAALYDRT